MCCVVVMIIIFIHYCPHYVNHFCVLLYPYACYFCTLLNSRSYYFRALLNHMVITLYFLTVNLQLFI